jgi:hypothetical protein
MRLSPSQKKDIADRFLLWLKDNKITTCRSTYNTIKQCSEKINEQIYDLWRAFDLLKTMGRVELNSPNGKYGFYVIDYTPLSIYQLKSDGFKSKIQKDMLTKILTGLKKQYKDIWDECLKTIQKKN